MQDRRTLRRAGALADRALARHRAGDLDGAEALYREALALSPRQPDGWHGLGVLALARGQAGRAIACIGRAIAGRPDSALFHLNLGSALLAQDHVEEARAALHVAVLRDPADPRAHAALAAALERLERLDEAAAAARTARDRDPAAGRPGALSAGAAALLARGEQRAGRLAPAMALWRIAAAEAPGVAANWQALGTLCGRLGELAEAEHAFRRVAALLADDPAVLANLGGVLLERQQLDEAMPLLRQAVAAAGASAESWNNLGLALMAQGALFEAGAALERAAALAPDSDGIANNLGTLLGDLGDIARAEAVFRRIEARPAADPADRNRARFNRGVLMLGEGRYAEGWAGFEARRALLPAGADVLPDWNGQALPGDGRVLVHHEQGLGDAIQFLRLLRPAAERAALRVSLPDGLAELAGAMLEGERCRPLHPGERCVAQAGLLSLPLLLGLDAPEPEPAYLSAPPLAADITAWRAALGPGMVVGLCWAGSPGYRFDRRRSLPLAALAPLGAVPGLRFVSLQQGAAGREASPPGLDPLEPPGPEGDLGATAALVTSLDLVISVDTAMAHLAGALGRPVWLLDRFGGDWRWRKGGLDSNGRSLWYPSLRPFRQDRPGDWAAPVARIAAALRDRAAGTGF